FVLNVLFVVASSFFYVLFEAFGILVEVDVQIGFGNVFIHLVKKFTVEFKFVVRQGNFRENKGFVHVVIANDKVFKEVELGKVVADLLIPVGQKGHFEGEGIALWFFIKLG